ncbi:MAG: acyltransferase [Clostridia bacterium]|nr:acyltransferase [Clostridia bacterium]
MNLIRKISLAVQKKMLAVKYAVSAKWYEKASLKYLKKLGVKLDGKPKFVARDVKFDSTDPSKISIGEGTVVTSKVTILVHDYSIECGLVTIGKQDPVYESMFIREVKIGKNCFIGQNSFITPGTEIGDNCIIGAGSVVRGKIPPNSVVTGNPAALVCSTDEWAEKKFAQQKYVKGAKRR